MGEEADRWAPGGDLWVRAEEEERLARDRFNAVIQHETFTQPVTLSSSVVYKAWCPVCGYLGHHWTRESAERAEHARDGSPTNG